MKKRRVIKLGGSLLDRADLPTLFERWRLATTPSLDIVIVGGGRLANALREYDRIHAIEVELSHHLCIDAMSINAVMVANLLPEISLLHDWSALMQLDAPQAVVFAVNEFLQSSEPTLSGTPLPHNWQVTSDSIAARVAELLPADELVLLKSRSTTSETPNQWREEQIVDDYFPTACQSLKNVSIVHLN